MRILRLVLITALLALASGAFAQNVVLGQLYDPTPVTGFGNPAKTVPARSYGVWYPSASAINDPTLPIAVYIHGGSWSGGTAYSYASITPTTCKFAEANTDLCALAVAGYAAYSINYSLATSDPATKWPAQYQDVTCFLSFLAEQAGVTVPGNPQRIYLFGHSAGGHLAAMAALAPRGTFPVNCSHTSTAYNIRAVMLFSPPLDLQQIYTSATNGGIKSGITNLLGCVPTVCTALADAASPNDYVAPGQPPTMVETGLGDKNVTPSTQGALMQAYAVLGINNGAWTQLPVNFTHDLDLFYFNPCSINPDGPSPSPCGSSGRAFHDMLTFFAEN